MARFLEFLDGETGVKEAGGEIGDETGDGDDEVGGAAGEAKDGGRGDAGEAGCELVCSLSPLFTTPFYAFENESCQSF